MKPNKILYVTRHVDGGVGTVIEQLVSGLDRARYEPVVLFETARKSRFRERLTQSNVKTIDLRKCADDSNSALALREKKNKKIGSRLEVLLGKKARKGYFCLKAVWLFFDRMCKGSACL